MTTITIEMPDDVFATLRRSPDELARDAAPSSGDPVVQPGTHLAR